MIASMFSAYPAPVLILGRRDRALVFFDELSRDQYFCNRCAWNLVFGIAFSNGRVSGTHLPLRLGNREWRINVE
jgi:hypothetical protein